VLSDALASLDPQRAERTMAPFRFFYGPGDPRCYVRQRRIVDALSADAKLDPMEVEEESMGVLADLLSRAYRAYGERRFSTASPADCSRKRDRSLAEDAKVAVGKIFHRHVPLSEIAASLGVSVFRLCRAFRRATGSTLHEFRNRLRLAASLERIGRRSVDLTDVALDLGYSSHSHFTAAFRREFGVTPSAFRREGLPRRAGSSRVSRSAVASGPRSAGV
jgi:AraC-like DNA-binding protein